MLPIKYPFFLNSRALRNISGLRKVVRTEPSTKMIFPSIVFVVYFSFATAIDGPPTGNWQLPTIACEEGIACFGSKNNVKAYGIIGENKDNSCIKGNNCHIRIRVGRYLEDMSKIWWELQVPAAWTSAKSADVVNAMFWVSKVKSNIEKPNGRIAIKAIIKNSPEEVKNIIQYITYDNTVISRDDKLVTNGKAQGFKFMNFLPNQLWEDDRRVYVVNDVHMFHFQSNTTLFYEDIAGKKCYNINLLEDKVYLHLTVTAPVVGASEQVVSDSPMRLFEFKNEMNNPSLPDNQPIMDNVACSVGSETSTPKSVIITPSVPPIPSSHLPTQMTPESGPETQATMTTSATSDPLSTTTRSLPSLPKDKDSKQSSSPLVFYILGGGLILALLLIALLCFLCRKKKKKRNRTIVNTRVSDSDPDFRSVMTSGTPSELDKRSKITSNLSRPALGNRDPRSKMKSIA